MDRIDFTSQFNNYAYDNCVLESTCQIPLDISVSATGKLNVTNLAVYYDKQPWYPNITNQYNHTVGRVNYTFSATSDYTGTCSLWGNWSGVWAINQTISVTTTIPFNFSTVTMPGTGESYIWNINCTDRSNQYTSWGQELVIDTRRIGRLALTWLNPAINAQHSQNQLKLYQFQLTCTGGNCSDVSVFLDPELRFWEKPHYVDEQGETKEIDTQIKDVTYDNQNYKGVTQGTYQTYFPQNPANEEMISVFNNKEIKQKIVGDGFFEPSSSSISINPMNHNFETNVLGSKYQYTDLLKDIDLVYEYQYDKLKELIKINKLPQSAQANGYYGIIFELNTDLAFYDNQPPKIESTCLKSEFLNETKICTDERIDKITNNKLSLPFSSSNDVYADGYLNPRFIIRKGVAWDSNGKQTETMLYIYEKENKKYLAYGVSYEWLKTAVFPVFIDPTYDDFEDGTVNSTAWTTAVNNFTCGGYASKTCQLTATVSELNG